MDLQSLRTEIDQIDEEILALFLRRMHIVEGVAAYKISNNMPVLHPARERQIIEKVKETAGEGMDDYAGQLFQCLLALSRDMQERLIAQNRQASV